MSIATVFTYTNIGLHGYEIMIEADSNKSLPTIEIIGLPDAAIKESKERIRATYRNCGLQLPPKKIIINLAPSHIKKVGTRFDLPIAVSILCVIFGLNDSISQLISKSIFLGELGLDGTIKSVQGILPSVLTAIEDGYTDVYIPNENVNEIKYLPNIRIFPLTNFLQVVNLFQGGSLPEYSSQQSSIWQQGKLEDTNAFGGVIGHTSIKRALSIAAAGMHNVLLVGPPGSGKTMLAKATSKLLPPLSFDEALTISKIYSVAGIDLGEQGICTKRPFRRVHHTASKVSIVGGGSSMLPGEISLAHGGVLFFDELPEFPRQVLDVLRQPLEDREITISRAQGKVNYPADFMFIAAMNPCVCGFFKDPQKECTCSSNEIKRYQSKISGPLLDRFDMILEVPRMELQELLVGTQTATHSYTDGIIKAREIQRERYKATSYVMNTQLHGTDLKKYAGLSDKAESFLLENARAYTLSPRVVHKLIRVARTISDTQGKDQIELHAIAEAIQYRGKSMFI